MPLAQTAKRTLWKPSSRSIMLRSTLRCCEARPLTPSKVPLSSANLGAGRAPRSSTVVTPARFRAARTAGWRTIGCMSCGHFGGGSLPAVSAPGIAAIFDRATSRFPARCNAAARDLAAVLLRSTEGRRECQGRLPITDITNGATLPMGLSKKEKTCAHPTPPHHSCFQDCWFQCFRFQCCFIFWCKLVL